VIIVYNFTPTKVDRVYLIYLIYFIDSYREKEFDVGGKKIKIKINK